MKNVNNNGWIDKYKAGEYIGGIKVIGIDDIHSVEYDFILVAIENEKTGMEVKGELIQKEVCEEKIILWGEI